MGRRVAAGQRGTRRAPRPGGHAGGVQGGGGGGEEARALGDIRSALSGWEGLLLFSDTWASGPGSVGLRTGVSV